MVGPFGLIILLNLKTGQYETQTGLNLKQNRTKTGLNLGQNETTLTLTYTRPTLNEGWTKTGLELDKMVKNWIKTGLNWATNGLKQYRNWIKPGLRLDQN